MNKNITRGLAIAAIAPLALFGAIGSSNAAQGGDSFFGADVEQVGDVITMNCAHPDFAPGELGFRAKIKLEGAGTGADFDDIEKVRIRATDNQGDGAWENDDARVKNMTVEYYDFDKASFGDAEIDPVYSMKKAGKEVRDGLQSFNRDRDNVSYVEVTVKWKEAGDGDRESLTCGLWLDNAGYEFDEELLFTE